MEISARGVTKGGALAELCGRLEIGPADVVAFGDMPNDLPMLRWAGTSYAVANAHPDVIAAASHRAPANHDDGVAVVLSGIFGL
jgi:hydroxymethylpyrimidine pyrophosphatase-like HAD family hydrolase